MTSNMPDEYNAWTDAALTAVLFAIDPVGIKGITLRAQPGPVRDAWLQHLKALFPIEKPWRRVPINIPESRLLGGLDLTATLQAGRPVAERGLLADADGGVIELAMAERLTATTSAVLGQVIDAGEVIMERDGLTSKHATRFGVIALDEGIGDEEHVPAGLRERFAFEVDLQQVNYQQCQYWPFSTDTVIAARAALNNIAFDDRLLEVLCSVALGLGIHSLRAPIIARRVACAIAALEASDSVNDDHIQLACKLVFAHRATCVPTSEQEQEEPPQPPEENRQQQDQTEEEQQQEPSLEDLQDIVLAATEAALSRQILEQLRANALKNNSRNQSGRSNNFKHSQLRGRPVGVRQGDPANGARLSVIETLRAAAPWQRLRQRYTAMSNEQNSIAVAKEDFRIRRFKQRTVTTTIFVVDASGSAALHRLAEVKGAVEMLLAECYQRRDQVALIAFRGKAAELVLPPTRSLVRAKRLLAGLPGGGGTPLAAGIDAAVALAEQIKQRGEMPSIVLLTDGRANIDRTGNADRAKAEQEAINAAQQVRLQNVSALLIDTSPRKQAFNEQVANAMDANYMALPHADAAALSSAVMGKPTRTGVNRGRKAVSV